jgi:uncharacterized protein (DUF362 family)/NAD-dependent dihydropyrimidine dehydrogenase PreA subunit
MQFQRIRLYNFRKIMSRYRVSVIRCDAYDPARVSKALAETFAHLDVSFKPGMRILIKPNLMSPVKPERAITTHPVVLEELCKILDAAGAELLIGESSFYNTDRAFVVCDIESLTRYARLINFETQPRRLVSFGGKIGSVPLPEILFQVDGIINVAKMKTHGLTGVTLCVKNLYGCIPGALKQGYHKTLPDPRSLSRFLIRLQSEIRPQLNIIDGIVGLEGEGPGAAGQPTSSGLVVAGVSACATDIIASEIMGFKSDEIYTNRYSGIRRTEIETIGNGREVRLAFKKPLSANFSYLIYFAGLLPRSRITFDPARCVRCGLCGEKCPLGAISFHPGPECDHQSCISCYCCMEVCPQSAISLREHWIRSHLKKIAKMAVRR